MTVHLDSNVAIGVLNDRGDHSARYKELRSSGEPVFISAIVAAELWYGIANSGRVGDNTAALRTFVGTLNGTLPFTDEEAAVAGDIRAMLRRAGTPIGPYDILIAAHAVRAAATLVTANAREFRRVPGLAIEDWSK